MTNHETQMTKWPFIFLPAPEAKVIFYHIEAELKKVRLQFKRIQQDRDNQTTCSNRRKELEDSADQSLYWKNHEEMFLQQTYEFGDVHYLMVSLAMIDKLFTALERIPAIALN